VVIHNAKNSAVKVDLPAKSDWNVVVEGISAGTKTLRTFKSADVIEVEALSTMVIHSK
jgi:hypothetical protein